jgi:hypothetical protein
MIHNNEVMIVMTENIGKCETFIGVDTCSKEGYRVLKMMYH